MSRFPRIATGGAAIAVAALALAACSPGESSSPDASGDAGVLRYISYWTEEEPTAAVFAEAIEDFEAETGVDVEVQWQGRDLPEILTPLLSSSDPKVDLVDFGCSSIESTLVSTGKAADLSATLALPVPGGDATVEEVLAPAAITTGQTDGSTFCVPFELTSNFDIWYNSATHPDIDSDSAATWDDFLDVLDEAGPGSLALDGTIGPYAEAWYINLAVSAAGPGALAEAAVDKTGEAFQEPEFLEAAQALQELVDGGYFTPGYEASKFPAIQQKWANDEAQYILNGSWLPAEVEPYIAEGFEPSSFTFPALSSSDIRPMQIDSIGFGVIEGSPNIENAQKFIAYFLQPKYQDQIAQLAIPARTDAVAAPALATVTAALVDDSITKIDPFDGSYVAAPGWNAEVLVPLVQKLAFGEIDADQFVTDLSANSKSYWELQG